MTRDWRRGVPNGRQPRRRSDIHDHADLVAPSALQDTRSVKGRGLDEGAGPVAARVERLAVKHAVDERVARREDRDTVDDEAFDLVHVEALVDPGDKERLGRLGLCADLAVLALFDLVGCDDSAKTPSAAWAKASARVGPHARTPTSASTSNCSQPASGGSPGTGRPVAVFRMSSQSISPNLLWRTAMIAGPAVSVRRIRGPTPMILQPTARPLSISWRDSPPSGPIRRWMLAPWGRVGGRL